MGFIWGLRYLRPGLFGRGRRTPSGAAYRPGARP